MVIVVGESVMVEPGSSVIVFVTTGATGADFEPDAAAVAEDDDDDDGGREADELESVAATAMPPSAPVASMMESAFASLVQAMNCWKEKL
jgi:hypothetical protein